MYADADRGQHCHTPTEAAAALFELGSHDPEDLDRAVHFGELAWPRLVGSTRAQRRTTACGSLQHAGNVRLERDISQ